MARKKAKKKGAEPPTTTPPPPAPAHDAAFADDAVAARRPATAPPPLHSVRFDTATLQQALELQAQEMEVLQAIYDRDLVLQTATRVYNYIFTIRLFCESFGADGAAAAGAATAEVLLHVDFGRAYPLKQPASIAVEMRHGLSKAETKRLAQELEALADEKLGDAMTYDLVAHATEFLQEHLKDQTSFFDQMVQRQQDRAVAQQRAEDAQRAVEEAQTQARTQALLASIDAERRRKQETLKKKTRSSARRRRRHRSSIDLAGNDESDGDDDDASSSGVVSTVATELPGDDVERRAGTTSDDDDDDSSSSAEAVDVEHPHSRYHGDFKELGLLGRGGGGEVVKVRNRLDRQLYAVKKVKLDPEDPTMKKKILREVKTISRMQHRHIVRYFQAWIEGDSGDASSDGESDDESDGFGDASDEQASVEHTSESSNARVGSSLELEASASTDEEDDWLGSMNRSAGLWSTSKHDSRRSANAFRTRMNSTSFHHNGADDDDDGFDWEGLEEAPSGAGDGAFEDSSDSDLQPRKPPPQQRQKALFVRTKSAQSKDRRRSERLYIQMEFCEGAALREVIDKGSLWREPDKIWTLFRQILEAIAYIHRQGIIHRDIKPPNIFLDAEGTVKLGDFGLAVRPPKVLDDDEDEDDNSRDAAANDSDSTTTASKNHSSGGFLSASSGASAAELYDRLKFETLESTRVAPLPLALPSSFLSASEAETSNITTGVGTAFYRAPEQERVGQRYNHKADMFSLGILFFEMWSPPFTTLMERAQALSGLRERHALPPAFRAPDAVCDIVLWLCQPSPALRPTAAELLASPLLPAKMEVEGTYLKEALETLANPEGKFFGQLIDALLTQEPVPHVDYTYDHAESTVKMRGYMVELRAKAYVKSVLQKVFERHGAVEHTTPLLMPRAQEHNFTGVPLTTPPSACGLLDGAGVSVTLPFDLTERLARFVARHNITRLKCFQFDRVYRRNVVGGHPRELLEADFDVIWDDRTPHSSSSCFLELEALEVVAEVISALAPSLGSYYLRLNDARITRAVLELCDVPVSARRETLKLLANEVSGRVHAGVASTLPLAAMKPARSKLIGRRLKALGATQAAVDALLPFFQLPEDCAAALEAIEHEVQKLFAKTLAQSKADAGDRKRTSDSTTTSDGTTAAARKLSQRRDTLLRRLVKECSDGVAALRGLLGGMAFLRLSSQLCTRLDVGLSPRPERYASGFIFQAVLTSGSSSSTATQVIAEGGRYDALVTRFKLPAAYVKASAVAAMGVRFSIDKIVACAAATLAPTALEPRSATCADIVGNSARRVLVCTAGKASETVLLRMQLALQLWRHGLGADYLHPDPMHLEDLEDYCLQHGIHWMVVVQKHQLREKKQVKIRAVKSPSEADTVVSAVSLVDAMVELLGSSHVVDALDPTGSAGGGGNGGSGGGGDGGGSSGSGFQPIFDVKVVDGKHYAREGGGGKQHKPSWQDTQKVTRRVSKWIASSFASRGEDAMKVLSVDLPFAVVRELSSALMDHGADGLERVSATHARYRKQLRYTTDELLALTPSSGGRERYVLLHSLVDDRYDLMSLVHASKAGGRKPSPAFTKRG